MHSVSMMSKPCLRHRLIIRFMQCIYAPISPSLSDCAMSKHCIFALVLSVSSFDDASSMILWLSLYVDKASGALWSSNTDEDRDEDITESRRLAFSFHETESRRAMESRRRMASNNVASRRRRCW